MNTKRLAACPFVKTQRLLCRTPFLFLTEPLSCAYRKFCVERVASFLAHSNGCLLFRAGLCVHFSCFAPVASFPALYFTYLLLARNWLRLFHRFKLLASFSCAWRRLRLFPRWTILASFSALNGVLSFPAPDPTCILSRAWRRFSLSRIWPKLHSLSLFVRFLFSRAWTSLHPLSRLTLVLFFPALKPPCILLRGWRRLRLFLLLTLHASYSALDTDREVCTSYNCGGPVKVRRSLSSGQMG